MSRFYVNPEDVREGEILVSREEAHHIRDVMRLSFGDEVATFDGTGKEYIGKIINTTKDTLRIKIEKTKIVKTEKKIYIALAQALPKRSKMDFIIEKATELGVSEIAPLVTERTVVKLDRQRQGQKLKHWKNIAISASKQCGRLDIPEVKPVMKFDEFLKEAKNYDLVLMACLNKETISLKEAISNFRGKEIMVMVGPEGDFSPKEIAAAKSIGVKLVSLGNLVLRVDTAAIFILSALSYEKF